MFSSWLSHGSSRNFIFTHISVLGVRQISSPMPPVGRELLFKVLCGWSPSATGQALLPLLGIDLGCVEGMALDLMLFAFPAFSAPSGWFGTTQVPSRILSKEQLVIWV